MAEVGCLRDAAFQNVEVNGVQYPGRVPIVNLGTTRTILPEESGTTFTVESAAGAYNVNLPAVALGRGCRFRFVAQDVDNGTVTIKSDSTNMYGVILTQSDTAESSYIAVVNRTNVLFAVAALHGDWIEVIGDGTNYYVSGQGSIQAAFTVS